MGQRKVSGWESLVFIAAGDTMTAGVKADGTLVLAGDGTALARLRVLGSRRRMDGLHSVAIGKAHMAGLKTDGTAVAAATTPPASAM